MKIKKKNVRNLHRPFNIPFIGRVIMGLYLLIPPLIFIYVAIKELGPEYIDDFKDGAGFMLLPWYNKSKEDDS